MNVHDTVREMNLLQAAEQGIERVRLPQWRDPLAHIKIDIIDGRLGPWAHLYDPFNTECNGRDPYDMLVSQADDTRFVAYTGPLHDSEEYKAAVKAYEGSLSR